MGNVDDFLRYRSEARVLFPTLKQWALVVQTGSEPEWLHFNSAGIPQYNIPLGYDMNANQASDLVGYHEPGHEYEEYLRLKDPTMAHRQKFMTFIGEPLTWAQQKVIADSQPTPNQQHDLDPGEWWADAFANGVAGRIVVDKDHTKDALANRAFFQSLSLPPVTHDIEWLGPVPSTNYFVSRSGNPITLIIDHWMAGSFDSALSRFMSPGAQVSAHYLISQAGRIAQVVRDEDTAYHAGNWTVNQLAIGIEHEGGPGLPPFPDTLYAASAWLHHKLSLDYGIRLVVGETVKPHRAIVPTQCPGTLDLDRIVAEAGGDDDMDRATFNQWFHEEYLAQIDPTIVAMKNTYDPLVPQAHSKVHKHDSVVDQPPMVVTTGDPK